MISTPIKWVSPPLGWFKFNTDCSSLDNPGLAGGGGVICNHVGDWVGGFSRAIGATTSVWAELRTLKDGLKLAIDLGILNLEIEMDSLVAVELVTSITTPNVFLSSIVTDCRSQMRALSFVPLSTSLGKIMIMLTYLQKLLVSKLRILFHFLMPQSIC